MEVEYINPFLESASEVFDTMVKLPVERGSVRAEDHMDTQYDVSGVIGLSGVVRGCVIMSFPEPMAREVVRRMVGPIVDDSPDLITDGIGELVNMVAGGAKTKMNDGGVGISLPTVVVGKQHRVRTGSRSQCVVVTLKSGLGEFAIQVSFEKVWKGRR